MSGKEGIRPTDNPLEFYPGWMLTKFVLVEAFLLRCSEFPCVSILYIFILNPFNNMIFIYFFISISVVDRHSTRAVYSSIIELVRDSQIKPWPNNAESFVKINAHSDGEPIQKTYLQFDTTAIYYFPIYFIDFVHIIYITERRMACLVGRETPQYNLAKINARKHLCSLIERQFSTIDLILHCVRYIGYWSLQFGVKFGVRTHQTIRIGNSQYIITNCDRIGYLRDGSVLMWKK